jgi:sterol desaturase/sphingolipid hydroxylase (fatty acid hydroxylase superfamily)
MWYPYLEIYYAFAIPFLLISITFWILDIHTNLIQYRYKQQDRKSLHIIYKKICPQVAVNLYILYPLLVHILSNFVNLRYDNFNVTECIYTFVISGLVFEIMFYFSHRLLHTKFLFNTVHVKHHELNISVAMGGLYCHSLEFICGNFIPAFMGIYLMQNSDIIPFVNIKPITHHVYTIYLWSISAAFSITLSHSGYFGTHIIHHWYQKCFYGTFGVMDFLCQTNCPPLNIN